MKRKLLSFARDMGMIALGAAVIAGAVGLLIAGLFAIADVWFRPADGALPAEDPAEGIGMRTETVGAVIALTGADWFAPEEAETVWEAPRDIGCPDWNVDSTLWGWDGHHMEVWEMDLYSRIVYLEFWGTSPECTEAGADSILRLWDLGEYGDTIGELLMAQYAPGYYVYSPMAYVWDWKYDAQGLANIRQICEEKFTNGPVWCAPYFRLWYYHDWATPCYCLDGVYFSVPAVTIGGAK